jgi:hypothetical protein
MAIDNRAICYFLRGRPIQGNGDNPWTGRRVMAEWRGSRAGEAERVKWVSLGEAAGTVEFYSGLLTGGSD